MDRCQRSQMNSTVNAAAPAFVGANPTLSTNIRKNVDRLTLNSAGVA